MVLFILIVNRTRSDPGVAWVFFSPDYDAETDQFFLPEIAENA